MKIIYSLIFITLSVVFVNAQNIKGKVLDKEMNNSPLPFVNIVVKGTHIGTTTDIDGNFVLSAPIGNQVLVFSFIGYKTIEKNIIVEDEKKLTVDVVMGIKKGGNILQNVIVTGNLNREKESSVMMVQKKSVSIKNYIGAQEMSRKGVSDISSAVTKIVGVSKQEGSNNIFVRGLGDRYNSSTLNGLPIPSNNPMTKNISLSLFSTQIVKMVAVNKIYSSEVFGDFGGANINIESKEHKGKSYFKVGVGTGMQFNADRIGDFYLQDGPNMLGFYSSEVPQNAVEKYSFRTSWDKMTEKPINKKVSMMGGKMFDMGRFGRLSLFTTASFSGNFIFKKGINRGGVNTQGIPDSELNFQSYKYNTETNAMLNLTYKLNENQKYKFLSIFINSSNESFKEYEGLLKRDDIDAGNGGGFVRRSIFDRTSLWINQILGDYTFNEQISLDWGVSHNNSRNIIPDRRQNRLIPQEYKNPNGHKKFSDFSPAENHRFFQSLNTNEIAFKSSVKYDFLKNENDEYDAKITFGYNGKYKIIDFQATQINFKILKNQIVNKDNLNAYFNQKGFIAGKFKLETFRGDKTNKDVLKPQMYAGNQFVNGGYINFQYKINKDMTIVLGNRVEQVYQYIKWETGLDPIGDDSTFSTLEILPNISFKYTLTKKQNLKFGASKTYTLPQYKEKAYFYYEEVNESQFGNPHLYSSTNYNADIRWEIFPKAGELISFTGFTKYIQNPINDVVVASSANDTSYLNTGDLAQIYGVEVELKKDIFSFKMEDKLLFGVNASYIYSNQDFNQKKIQKETKLSANFTNKNGKITGASDLILNSDITYVKKFSKDFDMSATLSYAYVSDKVFAIGTDGRGNLVDKGFGTMNLILKSKIFKDINLGLNLKNLLNPTIKRVQEIQDVEVLSFKEGLHMSFSLNYNF